MTQKSIHHALYKKNPDFELRGAEVKRIEAFSDAVFAFAVTLLIVSLEVPKSFPELMITIRGFLVFGISFVLLMTIWYEQNMFFRRYGLDDIQTIILNVILIFLVLFYVYPLKFLFTIMFQDMIYGPGKSPFVIVDKDQVGLMLAYGLGYILIYLLFSLMYFHALKNKKQLQLNEVEIFITKSHLYKYLIFVIIGVIVVVTSQIIPYRHAATAGCVFFIIGPVLTVYHSIRGKRKRLLIEKLASDKDGIIEHP